MNEKTRDKGEELVAAAEAGDRRAVRRLTDHFVLGARVDEGIPFWERAAPLDPWAACTLARYRKIRGDRAEAKRLYRAFAETDGGCAYGLGVMLQEDAEAEEADVWFRRGWELGRLDCKIEVAKKIAADGRPGEAADFLSADAALEDIASFHWIQLFEAMRETLEEVSADLDAADGPDAADAAIRRLGELREALRTYPGLLPAMEERYRRAAEFGGTGALLEHALTLDEAGGRRADAEELLHRALAGGQFGAAYVLGTIAQERGDLEEAERRYTEAADAGHPSALFNLGALYEALFRLDEAEEAYLRLGPDEPDVPERLAAVERKRSVDAAALHGRVADLPRLRAAAEAGDAGAGLVYGRTLHAWGHGTAREMLPWILPAAEAGDPAAADLAADLYRELKRPHLRDVWRRRAAELGDLDACTSMGYLSGHHRDWQEAERWYDRAAAQGDGLASMLAGKLRAQRGAYAEAEPLLRRAWAEGEDHAYGPEAAAYYGLVLHRLGRSVEAVPLLEVATDQWERIRARYGSDDLDLLARTPDIPAVLEEARSAAAPA